MRCASRRRSHLVDCRDGTVTVSSTVLNLEAYLDESLSMSEHDNRLVRSCFFYQLHRIRHIRRSLTTAAAIHPVIAFIIARVDCCNIILVGLPRCQLNPDPVCLDRCIANHVRTFKFRPRTTTSRSSEETDRIDHGCRSRLTFDDRLLVCKTLHGLAPVYVTDFCVEVSSGRKPSRSSSSRRLTVPSPVKTAMLGERSFALNGSSLWNLLPDTVKQAGTVENFKRRLKTHLSDISYP